MFFSPDVFRRVEARAAGGLRDAEASSRNLSDGYVPSSRERRVTCTAELFSGPLPSCSLSLSLSPLPESHSLQRSVSRAGRQGSVGHG